MATSDLVETWRRKIVSSSPNQVAASGKHEDALGSTHESTAKRASTSTESLSTSNFNPWRPRNLPLGATGPSGVSRNSATTGSSPQQPSNEGNKMEALGYGRPVEPSNPYTTSLFIKTPKNRMLHEEQDATLISSDSESSSLVLLPLKASIAQGIRDENQRYGIPIAPSDPTKPFAAKEYPMFGQSLAGQTYSPGRRATVGAYPAQDAYQYQQSEEELPKDIQELVQEMCEDLGDDDIEETTPEDMAKGCRLLPHQLIGLKWLKTRELGKKRGGILADDMGLGKTVQMIALILANPPSRERNPKTGEKPPKGTLIVTPLAVMRQWQRELRDKVDEEYGLRICMHRGPDRTKDAKKLERYDIVITTYETLVAEMRFIAEVSDDDDEDAKGKRKVKSKPKAPGPLSKANFHRVILDEAHRIKNRSTQASKACAQISGQYRWALTGTPIQNSVDDLFPLLRFIVHRPLNDWSEFSARISKPMKRNPKLTVGRLKVTLHAVMLRRTKESKNKDGKPILNLPGTELISIKPDFGDPEERDFYQALETKTQLQVNKFMKSREGLMGNYSAILVLLLRLRQACSHPYLVTKSDKDALQVTQEKSGDDAGDKDMADLEKAFDKIVIQQHNCEVCLEACGGLVDGMCGPCYTDASRFSDLQFSTKIRETIKVLEQIRKADPKQKTIVFSQFTSFFDLLRPFLKRAGLKFVDYVGSMSNDDREESLDAIREKSKVTIILISLKCGALGLNLTCCSNVVFTDLWWNPMIEQQATDRANRLGQTRKVNVYKITIQNTIEDRILELQEKKRAIADGVVGDAVFSKMQKLQAKDILYLFGRNAS